MLYRESEEELIAMFPDFYNKPPTPDPEFIEDKDESIGLLYEGGKGDEESDKKSEEKEIRPRLNYHFMDGMRGLGAFAVYLQHFMKEFLPPHDKAMIKKGESAIYVQPWLRYPPAAAFYHGYLWVEIFFILSGFVLPQNFFKTGRAACLTGGVMRRYFRLMVPVLMILSIYLAVARFDLFGETTLNKLKNKTFANLLYAALLETWAGPSVSFIEVTWTLGIEFWATFLVYLIAFTGHAYRGRFFFYIALIFFFWTVEYLGFLNLIPWKTNRPFK